MIVKLTADTEGCRPSQMHVFDDDDNFSYGVAAGSAALFDSTLVHASVAPAVDAPDLLKLAFFFRV